MDTEIKQVSPVEYELEITATADELAPQVNTALKTQRSRTSMKGFRTGKVPLSMVKKMYGEALAYGIAEKSIQEKYELEVVEPKIHDVVGQPKLTKFDYKMDGDLKAVIRFGVKPEFELEDMSGIEVNKLVHEVTDEEVQSEIDRLRNAEADLIPTEDAATEDDFALVSIQRLDDETGEPIIGDKQEDIPVNLSDDRLKAELKAAIVGLKAGESRRVDMPHEGDHGDHGADHEPHSHAYTLEVKEVKKRDLPEIDEEFVKSVSKGEVETVDAFKDEIRKQLRNEWEKRSTELLEGSLMLKSIEAHSIEIPDSIVDIYLDSFVEDVKRRSEGKLPEGFNEDAFRFANRDEAARQARWMLIKEKIIDVNKLEVTDEEISAYFADNASDGSFSSEDLENYYRNVPGLMDGLKQQQLSKKVFEYLESKVMMTELDKDAYEAAETEENNLD